MFLVVPRVTPQSKSSLRKTKLSVRSRKPKATLPTMCRLRLLFSLKRSLYLKNLRIRLMEIQLSRNFLKTQKLRTHWPRYKIIPTLVPAMDLRRILSCSSVPKFRPQ